jgi:4-amino-4-deoxy-L-arabinose transferase-like glycosyltransferase
VLNSTAPLNLERNFIAEKYPRIRWEAVLYLIIVAHIIAWTLIPYLIRYNLPQDAIEASMWGQHFEWGYDKNPFLNAWLSALATLLDNHAGWACYFFSQLSVGICFFAVWCLGKKMLPPLYAFVGVLLLEGVQYYSLHAIDFNDNTLELAVWALTILSFYNALNYQRYQDWLFTGVFAALALMTKYYAVMLLVPMLAFLLRNKTQRGAIEARKLLLAACAFLLIILPHVIWLLKHDFITLRYALTRVVRAPEDNYFSFAILFLRRQLETFIPAFLLACVLILGKKPLFLTPRIKLASFDKQFLLYLALGPYFLTVLTAAFTGIQLRAGWGEPLLSLWGIMLIAFVQPRITRARFCAFMVVFVGLVGATLTGYTLAITHSHQPTSANFPGAKLAHVITHEWHHTFHTPLYYVAGSRWMAGNIAYYSSDHPQVFVNWDKNKSQWIDEEQLKIKGAVFIWEMKKNEKLTPELARRFEKLGPVRIMHFPWWRFGGIEPIEIAVAYLPPQITLMKLL